MVRRLSRTMRRRPSRSARPDRRLPPQRISTSSCRSRSIRRRCSYTGPACDGRPVLSGETDMDPMVPGSSNPDYSGPGAGDKASIRRNPDGTLPEDLAKPPVQEPNQQQPNEAPKPPQPQPGPDAQTDQRKA